MTFTLPLWALMLMAAACLVGSAVTLLATLLLLLAANPNRDTMREGLFMLCLAAAVLVTAWLS